MDKETVLTLTDKWKELWVAMNEMLINVLEKWIELGFYDMNTLYDNINHVAKQIKFVDEGWNEYNEKENKSIRKQHIHLFVWCFEHMKGLYWENVQDLLKKCRSTIERIQSI